MCMGINHESIETGTLGKLFTAKFPYLFAFSSWQVVVLDSDESADPGVDTADYTPPTGDSFETGKFDCNFHSLYSRCFSMQTCTCVHHCS